MFMIFPVFLICIHNQIIDMITGIVFSEDIIIGPLLIPSLIDLVKLQASVVVHERDCAEVVL